jgi:DNA-binding GntR family transcriptional regulator
VTRREQPVAAPADGSEGVDVQGTLAQQLFQRLSTAILQGELPLGSKISEPVLAQRYGVSRGPLREALHRLQERHLITRSANQGARVVEATPEMLASIFAVREVLEGLAAREAARRMTERDIASLRAVVARHEAGLAGLRPDQHNALGAADQDFHFRIAQSSGNPMLIGLLCDELYPLLRLYRSRRDNPALRARALVEHQRILAAIEEHDAELAELLMRRHIASAGRRRGEALTAGVSEISQPAK